MPLNKTPYKIKSDDPQKNIVLSNSVFEDGMERASSTSQFVGIDLNNRGFPVIVYFADDCIRVARANADYPKGKESYWKVQRAVTKNYSMNYVTYVDCEVDSSGYLHIVFVNTSGELVYIKSTNNPSDGTKYTFAEPEVVTDGSPSCIDITTRGETPYIACISSINAVDGLTMAFKSDGKWEVMKSPLVHTVAQNRACIEAHPTPATGWGEAAVGYYSNQDQRYHAAYYIGNGKGQKTDYDCYPLYVLFRKASCLCVVFGNVFWKICRPCSFFHVCDRNGMRNFDCKSASCSGKRKK